MPTYSSTYPPLSLFPGDVGFSWNNEAIPADGTAGAQFALPQPAGFPDHGRAVRWQTIYTGSPTAVNVRLQAAIRDVDAEYVDLDTSTVIAGESRSVSNVRARFLRIKKISSTGGTNITAMILP